jgi:alpha-L-fucosidase
MNPISRLRPTFQLTMHSVSPNTTRNQINQIFRQILLAAVLGMALVQSVMAEDAGKPYEQESAVQRDARMKWFREARFGMFIHWGLYSQAAGEFNGKPTSGAGEWIMNDLQIHPTDYAKLVPKFNPVKFDAREWVRLAKGAGMKYICITTKHHDGFALYPSALTDWCIKSTPFQRDPLKELATACKEEGITLCFYHSIMDWHHPEYAPRKSWYDGTDNTPDFEKYDAFLKGELKELLTGYGPIGIIWFDGNWENTWNFDRGVDLYKYVRSLQPNTIVNNRVGRDRKGVAGTTEGQERIGDYGTPEQSIPANGYGPGVDWETCMTMNDTWGYKKSDDNWKSTQTLVRNLIDCASKGGNYLLNVGPTGEGLIPDASIQRLKEVGDWMKVNGDAVYATTASSFSRQLPWGRCTTKISGKTTTLYLHVFDWPADGELLVPGLKNKIKSARLLVGSKKLATQKGEDGVTISLPASAPTAISSTVVLTVEGAPDIAPMVLLQNKNGSVDLPASLARLHGGTFKYESGGPLDNIGFWTDSNDWADWVFKIKRPGTFEVSADIAAPASNGFEISLGDQTIRCAAPVTANYQTFQSVKLGKLEISSAGDVTLAVHPLKDHWQPMNLKAIRLTPVTNP